MIVGLVMSVALAHGSVIKAVAMVVFGLLLGLVGMDVISGAPRLNFGLTQLGDQLNFVAIAVGLFGIAEILRNLEDERTREVLMTKVTGLMPTRAGFPPHGGADPARHGARLGARHPARQRRGARRLRLLHDRKAPLDRTRRNSATARSPASPDRNRPTMPARRPPSSRC